jgi:hypothetical protein
MACPSATTCYAVGRRPNQAGVALSTTDGGATWVTHSLPAGIFSPGAVACPSAASCYVVAASSPALTHGRIAVTVDGGATWTTQTLPPATPGLSGVACPSTATCYAVGGVNHAVEATTNGGATWTSQPLPATSKDQLTAVSCPATTTCYVVGNAFTGNYGGLVFATSDGGSRWVKKALPGNSFGALEAVACPSVSTCYVAGVGGGPGLVAVTSDGGATWTVTNESGHPAVRGVASASSTTCYAATQGGSGGWYTGVVLATTDSGAQWGSQGVPPGITSLTGIACPATCFATGSGENAAGAVILSRAARAGTLATFGVQGPSVAASRTATHAAIALSLSATPNAPFWSAVSAQPQLTIGAPIGGDARTVGLNDGHRVSADYGARPARAGALAEP